MLQKQKLKIYCPQKKLSDNITLQIKHTLIFSMIDGKVKYLL